MIDVLKEKLLKYSDEQKRFNYLREELQLLILSILDVNNSFKNIAFLGGTALRIIYKIGRFSEDLDFSLINKENYDFDKLASSLEVSLERRNLKFNFKTRKRFGAVRSIFIRFSEVLYELGLSPLKSQNLFIKFEIDENPPLGFQTDFTRIKEDNAVIGINHFDKASLYAGKLNAILSRQYTKGRDFFDLLWFLGQGLEPNYEFLTNAYNQQNKTTYVFDRELLKKLLVKRLSETDFDQVQDDLRPFIADKDTLKHYNKEFFMNFVNR